MCMLCRLARAGPGEFEAMGQAVAARLEETGKVMLAAFRRYRHDRSFFYGMLLPYRTDPEALVELAAGVALDYRQFTEDDGTGRRRVKDWDRLYEAVVDATQEAVGRLLDDAAAIGAESMTEVRRTLIERMSGGAGHSRPAEPAWLRDLRN